MDTNKSASAEIAVKIPTTMAEISPEILKELGVKTAIPTVTSARKGLEKAGVAHSLAYGVGDTTAILMDAASTAFRTADKGLKSGALLLAVIDVYKPWEHTADPSGKVYGVKGKQRFLADLMPEYSVKSLLTYTTAARQIALPIAQKDVAYEGLEELGALPLGTLKELNNVLVDKDGTANSVAIDYVKARLEDLKAEKRVPKVKDLVEWRKTIKGAKKTTDPKPGAGESAGAIAEQLDGGATKAALSDIFKASWTGDELYFAVDSANIHDLGALLEKAVKDKNAALAFVTAFKAMAIKTIPARQIKE